MAMVHFPIIVGTISLKNPESYYLLIEPNMEGTFGAGFDNKLLSFREIEKHRNPDMLTANLLLLRTI